MRFRAHLLFLTLLSILLIVKTASQLQFGENLDIETLNSICESEDLETILGCQKKPPRLGLNEIELASIPGINQKVARILIENRDTILEKASSLPTSEQYKAFVGLKGIKEKRAKLLANEAIDLSSSPH